MRITRLLRKNRNKAALFIILNSLWLFKNIVLYIPGTDIRADGFTGYATGSRSGGVLKHKKEIIKIKRVNIR